MKAFKLLTNKVSDADIKKITNVIKHPFKAGSLSAKFGKFIKRNG